MYIGDKHFNNGSFYSGHCIADGNRSMCIARGVQYDPIMILCDPLQFIDDLSFHVALEIADLSIRETLFKLIQEFVEGHNAIDIRFSCAKQVKIGAVDDRDLHGTKLGKV